MNRTDQTARQTADVVTLVTNAYARLAQAADLGTLEEYTALLHPDVVWEMPAMPATGLPAQVRTGRDEVLAGAVQRREQGIQGPGSHTWHVLANVAVTPDPDGGVATARAYWFFWRDVDARATLVSTGVYTDRFVDSPDGWLLRHRVISQG